MTRSALIAALCLSLVAPAAVSAQELQPLSWVAFSKVKTGKTQDAVAVTRTYDEALYEQLVEEGTILSWGIATPINHRPGDRANHAVWVTVPGWPQVDRWIEVFQQSMQARGGEEMAEIQEQMAEIYEPGSHYDSVRNHLYLGMPAEGATPPSYLYVSTHKVAWGQEARFVDLYRQIAVPVAESLQREGRIYSFGLQNENLHGAGDWTHLAWYTVTDLAAVQALQGGLSAALTPDRAAEYLALADRDAHRDTIWLILHQSRMGGGEQ